MRLFFLLLLSVKLLAAGSINVSSVATAGNGSKISPWTGWDTAIVWVGEQQYNFPSGVYAYSTSPNFLKSGIALIGEAGTVLKHTGSGNAVVFDNPTNWNGSPRMENFTITGNASTTNALFLRGVRNGIFRNIWVTSVTGAGLWSEACVTNLLENFVVQGQATPSIRPTYGIVLGSRPTDFSSTTTWTITNPVVEGTSQIGIWIKNESDGNTFVGGTSEANLGKGAVVSSMRNTFLNMWLESNTGNDLEVTQSRNIFINTHSNGEALFTAGQQNRVTGGQFHNITISYNVDFTALEGVLYDGTLNDAGFSTIKLGNQGTLDGGLHFESYLGHVVERMPQLTSGGTVETDASRFSKFWFVVYQNFTLTNPINGVDGQAVTWRIQQDNTGGRVISFGSKFRAKGSLPVLSTASLEFDYITARYNAARDTWDIQ